MSGDGFAGEYLRERQRAALWKAYALAYRQWHLTPDGSEARIAETWAEFKKAEKALQDAGEIK